MFKGILVSLSMVMMMYSCQQPVPPPPALKAIQLTWIKSPTPSVSYRVYRGTAHGGPYTEIVSVSKTSYLDNAVTHGLTYYYVTRAFNGVESTNSNELKITVP